MPGIFISYRREDSGGYAGRIHEALAAAFGKERVFIDIDSIAPGEDFPAVVRERIAQSSVLLALIGKSWLRQTDESGRRRLEDPRDFVRMEIAAALQANVRIIPVLVGGARMPGAEELPSDIAPLAVRNAHEMPDHFFGEALKQLVGLLRPLAPPARPWRKPAGLTAGAVLTIIAVSAALTGIFREAGRPAPRSVPKASPEWPRLEQPERQAYPVVVRTPPRAAGAPEAVSGPGAACLLGDAGGVLGPRKPRLLWAARVTIGDAWHPAGVAPDGTVYLWDEEHNTLAGIRDGAELWAFAFSGGVDGIAQDGSIWMYSNGQGPCSFNSKGEGGCLPRGAKPPPGILRGPRPYPGTPAVQCAEGHLQPGAGGWRFDLDGNCASWEGVRDAAGKYYAGSDRGTLFCISPGGKLLWKYAAGSEVSRPLLAGGDVMVADSDGLVAIRDGAVRWRHAVKGARPALADKEGTVYLTYSRDDNYVGAIDSAGKLVWARNTGLRTYGLHGIDSQGRLFLTSDSALVCLGDQAAKE